MALLLLLAKDQYYQSEVTRFRGDRWTLDAKVVNRVGGVDTDKDLTGASASAFFPPATGTTPIAVAATLSDAPCGKIRFSVDKDTTPLIAECPQGTTIYATINGLSESPVSVETPDADLVVVDKGFSSS